MVAEKTFTHFNRHGEAQMVDVGMKPMSERKAVADGCIYMTAQTLQMIAGGEHKKGDVLAVARIAGIMAAKRTAELIPLCHPIVLTRISVDFEHDPAAGAIKCTATAHTCERTGVEMEALTAVQISLLTIYDMCKAVDRDMRLSDIRLLHKSGGRSGQWTRPAA